MPFDGAKFSPSIGDLVTLDGLRSWLESLPPETDVGTFMSCDNCTVARYLLASGVRRGTFAVGGDSVRYLLSAAPEVHQFPADLVASQDRVMYANRDWTWGASITSGRYLESM